MSKHQNNTVPVVVSYDQEHDLAVGSFLWPKIDQTFDVTPNRYLSLRLDGELLGRLTRIWIYQTGAPENIEILEQITNAELASYLSLARSIGRSALALETTFTVDNQAALTELSLNSSSMPTHLRDVAELQRRPAA